MIMRHVLTQGMMQRRSPKENKPRETLLLDGAWEDGPSPALSSAPA